MPITHHAGDVRGILTVVCLQHHEYRHHIVWLVQLLTARPERLVSLYLTDMSLAVSRMASMASSNVTEYTPSLAIAS